MDGMMGIGRAGMIIGALATLAGCSDCKPPPPPPPQPAPDMAQSQVVQSCDQPPANNNAGMGQGPEIRGTVIGTYCYLGSIQGVNSLAPLGPTAVGLVARTDKAATNGLTMPLQITPITTGWSLPDPNNPECGDCLAGNGPPRYSVTYTYTDGTTRPLCPGGRDALLVRNFRLEKGPAGTTTTYTFACPGSALWHCALDWGFDPEAAPDLFKTCLRAEIADYCGEGSANTVTGVPLFLSRHGGRPAGQEWSANPEAIWGPNGAICVATPRVTYRASSPNTVLSYITSTCSGVKQATCPAPDPATADTGNLLVSYPMGIGASPLCDHGQACGAAPAAVPARPLRRPAAP